MPAKNIGGFPTAPTQVNLAAVGARNISRPTIVTHATQQGAVNVQQIRPSPGVVPASVTARAVAAQPNRGGPILQRRPGVAQRPGTGIRPTVGNGQTTARVVPTPTPAVPPAPPITPLTIEQGMFLTHLVDGFLLVQKENEDVDEKVLEFANGSLAMLHAWMSAVNAGEAKSGPISSAPPAHHDAAPAAAAE